MVASKRIRLMTATMTLVFLLSCGTQTVNRNNLTVEELKDLAIMSLEPGDAIRYTLAESNQRVEGVVQQTGPDGLHAHSNDEIVFLATDSIEWLWIRRRSVKTGALIGAIPGFVVTTVFFAIGLGSLDESILPAAPLCGCVGALATGTAGAAIGAVVPRWELLF